MTQQFVKNTVITTNNSVNMKLISLISSLFFFFNTVQSQNSGSISGTIIDKNSQKPIQGVAVVLDNSSKGTVTDVDGKFAITGISTTAHNIRFSCIGYLTQNKYNVIVSSGNITVFNIELEPEAKELNNVTVKSKRLTVKAASLETPLSVQRLTTEEIKANPGGNFDISRVIQALPGVGGTDATAGFRNDIIIRGGAPNENVFYLDGIEIPVINHFATQGSSGGPTGILNVSFIEDVKLSSSAFDARADNALSSVFEFKQKKGNTNKLQGNVRLSGTELAATFDGPLAKNKNSTFLASVRRSYLQFLFQAIDLPIRPNYWDFQFKTTHQLNKKTALTLLGIGALDEFSFAAPKKATPEKLYVLNSNPSINQNSYTIGASVRKQINKGYWNMSLSRNYLDNDLQKFENNLGPVKGLQTLASKSAETENKLRFDVNTNNNGFKLSYGAMLQLNDYSSNTNQLIKPEVRDNNNNIVSNAVFANFNSNIQLFKAGIFVQAGKRFFDNRLGISAGIRTDGNNFTENGWDIAQTISPRISFSYVLTNQWNLNASVGRYSKIPPYTILGFKNNNNQLVNKNSKYIISNHYVAGVEYLKNDATRFTVETFYKQYSNVPVSVKDGISLSNLGADFNVLGNEAITSTGKGRSYGIEFFAQQKLTKRFFGVFSYTWFKSEYTNANNQYTPSSWDNNHLLSLTCGYKFNRNWELGLKFRYQGAVPLTPFDDAASRANYLTLGQGTLNYSQINSQRLNAFNSSDIRIDKKWNYKKVTLDLYLDVSNWYAAKAPSALQYTFKRNDDNTAFVTTDGQPIRQNGSNAIPVLLLNNEAQITPTIGFIVEF
jgi:outer membrane receptor for ferrienterochelin and colicin